LPVVIVIAARTDRLVSREVLAVLDTALADHAASRGLLSRAKLETAIDMWVISVDPDAVRRTRSRARDREVQIGDPNDGDGITTIFGRLLATDARLLDTRLTAMARSVCDADPRTAAQRRADALGALAAGSTHLACTCGAPACPASAGDGRASSIVNHVLAEAQTLDTATDPGIHGGRSPDITGWCA